MPGLEELLRDQFEQMAGVVAADSASVLARVRTRRRRGRVALAGMATFALLAAGIIGAGFPWAKPDEPSQPQVRPPTQPTVGGGASVRIEGASFANPTTGYVLAATCPEGGGVECDWVLATTGDGGGVWERRSLPPGWSANQPSQFRVPRFLVLGPQTLALLAPAWDSWWLSLDGGHNWRAPAPLPSATMTSIPAGASFLPLGGGRLRVLTPDGTGGVLAVDAGGAVPKGGRGGIDLVGTGSVTAADGSIWIPCATNSRPDHDACVLVSRDGGRAWQSIRPSGQRVAGAETDWISTVDGRDVLVGVSSAGTGYSAAGVDVYRSRDGGATWTTVRLPKYGVDGGLVVGLASVQLLADGSMIAGADGKLYRSAPGSSTFTPVSHAPKNVTSVAWSGSQLLAATFPAPGQVAEQTPLYRSADGRNWRAIRLP